MPKRAQVVVNILLIIVLTLMILGAFSIRVNAENHQAEIDRIFAEINTLIGTGDVEGILAYYNVTKGSFFDKTRIQYENLLKLDSLSYHLQLNELSVDGENATAIVYEKKWYYKFERGNTEVRWQTWSLVQTDAGWRIDDKQERTYLQAEFADIDMTFYPAQQNMTGVAKIDITVVEGGENNILLWLNRGLTINKIANDKGKSVPFERSDLTIVIPWETTFQAGEQITLNIDYTGNFYNEFVDYGYSLSYIGEEGCFANFVTQWYPKVIGTLTKSKAKLTYTVPKDLIVASVGKFMEKVEKGNQVTYIYEVTTPMDYTFNANKFFHYSHVVDGIQVNVYFLEGGKEKARMYADESMKIVTFLKELYGIFPYDSYNISEVPPEITKDLGGSGGQGLNFYPVKGLRDDVFEFPLLAHEIGHMWWGSWVMSGNNGAMIDEGFSQLNVLFCYRHFYGEKAMWDFLREGTDLYPQSAKEYFTRYGTGENDLPMAVYDENRESDFVKLAYVKSHFVYAMLMETVGYDTFIKGIRRIISDYANKRFDINKLQEIMEDESEMDLAYFFEQWFYRPGAPEFEFEYSINEMESGKYEVTGVVNQVRDIYQVTAEIELATVDHREVRKIVITGKETPFSYNVNYKPTAVFFDPDYKILRWIDEFRYLGLLGDGVKKTYTGQSEEAVTILTKFLEHMPNDVQGHTFLGQAYLNLEKYEEAQRPFQFVIEWFEETNRINFWIPYAYTGMGEIYDKQGNTDKAAVYFTKVLELINVEGTHAKAKAFFARLESDGIH